MLFLAALLFWALLTDYCLFFFSRLLVGANAKDQLVWDPFPSELLVTPYSPFGSSHGRGLTPVNPVERRRFRALEAEQNEGLYFSMVSCFLLLWLANDLKKQQRKKQGAKKEDAPKTIERQKKYKKN